jgi:NADH-quinone oxidoreductase subunit K
MIEYFMLLSIALFAIGISGVAVSRHFLIMVFSIEIMIIASSLFAISVFSGFLYYGNIVLLLVFFWSIAAVDIIAAMVLYRYLVKSKINLDVTKLSEYKD